MFSAERFWGAWGVPDPESVPHAAKASTANPTNQGVAKVNLPTAPAASVFAVLDRDALRGKDVSDFVGRSPVLVRFGVGAQAGLPLRNGRSSSRTGAAN